MALRFSELPFLFAQTASGLAESALPSGVAGVGMELLTVVGVGLLIAIALQALLLILGGAIAVTLLPLPTFAPTEPTTSESKPDLPIGMFTGLGILGTVNFVLFIASYLAIALIQCDQPRWGAIAGIVLWAAYFLTITWFSLRTFNSWSETILSLVKTGLRRFIALLVSPFQSASDDSELNPATVKVAIQEAVQSALTTQFAASVSPETRSLVPEPSSSDTRTESTAAMTVGQTLQQQLQQYLQQADVKQLAAKPLEHTLHQYFATVPSAHLPLAAQTFQIDDLQPILTARPDLSPKKQTRILRQIHTVWATYTQALPPAAPPPEPTTLNWAALAPIAAQLSQVDVASAIAPLQSLTTLPETIQQVAQTQLDAFQQSTQTRLTATRKTIAITLWWLVATVCTGAISAALAGAIAAGFQPWFTN